MYKFITQLFLIFTVSYTLHAQIRPAEGSKLHYRIIGFSFPNGQPGSKYTIQIAEGNYSDTGSFKEHIVNSFRGDNNKIIGEVPTFGKEYTWCAVSVSKDKIETRSDLHHFSTLIVPDVDTHITRLRILQQPEIYTDAYVFLDASRTLYDMRGNPVWYVPIVDGVVKDNFPSYGDLKVTPQKTISFITNRKSGHIYEINYNGDILWKGPNTGEISGDSIENYNHEFTRLANGNYMVLGGEYVNIPLPRVPDSIVLKSRESKGKIIWDPETKTFSQRIHFGTLIEYDAKGNVVWSWRSSKYFKESDVYKHTHPLGFYEVDDVHENAFYFDEKAKEIYISFRNMSRIVKIKYPKGKVLDIYGKLYDDGKPGFENKLFYHQHSCRITEEGYLSVYNNNDRKYGTLPTLVIMEQPDSKGDTLKKIWEYECTTDGIDPALKRIPVFAGLGCVMEIPDHSHSMFACMANDDYTRVFIVNREKQTLWSALPERWVPGYKKWSPILEYKPSIIIDRDALEELIWSAETK